MNQTKKLKKKNRKGRLGEELIKRASVTLPVGETRPVCHIWQKKTVPLACTASTTCLHAPTCSALQIPGTSGYPLAVSDTAQASATSSAPRAARCA